jgi:hypothetical protein
MALAAGFGVLVLMLGYWQVIAAGELDERADNPYQLEKKRLVDRGRIISADKVVLAESVAYRQNDKKYYRRYYPQGSLAAQVVGYATPEQGATGLEQQYNRYLAGSYGTGAILDRLREEQKEGGSGAPTSSASEQEQAALKREFEALLLNQLMKTMRDAGSYNLVQNEATCVVFGMPREAIAHGAANEVLPLQQIAPKLLEWLRTNAGVATRV